MLPGLRLKTRMGILCSMQWAIAVLSITRRFRSRTVACRLAVEDGVRVPSVVTIDPFHASRLHQDVCPSIARCAVRVSVVTKGAGAGGQDDAPSRRCGFARRRM
jgi:hypothetical protein